MILVMSLVMLVIFLSSIFVMDWKRERCNREKVISAREAIWNV
jgi:hypothetical protein